MNLKTIQRYHSLGFTIHPLCPHNHHCQSPGKIPYIPEEGHMSGWQKHSNYHLDNWDEWLDLEPEINLGMLCGTASNLVGIDVDDEGGEDLIREYGHDPTWEYTTGRGRRLLFRHTEPMKSMILRADEERHLEVLADGRNNVLPPSVHPSGRSYAWTPGYTPRDIPEPAELPEWVFGQSPVSMGGGDDISSDEIDWVKVCMNDLKKGNRNNTMTRIAGWLLNQAPPTRREAFMLMRLINDRFSDPPMPVEEVKAVARSINRAEKNSEAALKKRAYELKDEHQVSFDTAWEMALKERRGGAA